MVFPATRLGEDICADQQAELDADAGESDSVAARLYGGRDVVEPPQLGAAHACPVICQGKCRAGGIRQQRDDGGSGVERIRHHLREHRFLQRARVRVREIFEEVQQVDARFAHRGLSLAGQGEPAPDQVLRGQGLGPLQLTGMLAEP